MSGGRFENKCVLCAQSVAHTGFRYLRNPELGFFDVCLDVDLYKFLSEPGGHQGSFQGTFDLHKHMHVHHPEKQVNVADSARDIAGGELLLWAKLHFLYKSELRPASYFVPLSLYTSNVTDGYWCTCCAK